MSIINEFRKLKSETKKLFILLTIFVVLLLSAGIAFSNTLSPIKSPDELIEELDYKAMYRANLDKIAKVQQELENTQDSNYWYEIQNREITSLHILKYGYESLNNRDFSNDPRPDWINKMYYDKYKSLQNIKKAVKRLKESNDKLISNYHKLVDHGHDNLDDHIAIDTTNHIRVNNFRLINK